MKIIKLILSSLSFTMLAACATPYVKSGEIGGIQHGGYDDVVTNSNTAIVTFDGNKYNTSLSLHNYLLYRCAEVTLQQGYRYFVITSISASRTNIALNTKTTDKPIYPPPSFIGNTYSATSLKSYQLNGTRTPNSPAQQCDLCRSHAVSAVIKMFGSSDKQPPNMPRTYSAEDVIAHYGYSTID